jgi:hypothetical protein
MIDNRQHEPGDELLSAYIDDELSADERALVEARLATDPAAQQSLDQLRSVSQSVRSLPKEPAPRDLQDSVLHRIESLKKEPKQPAAATPAVSIGRTRRGWVWASLAVAAALLIMFVQADNEENDTPLAVALNEPTADKESEQLAKAPAQWHAPSDAVETAPQAPSGEPQIAAAPAAREPVVRDLNESIATDGRALAPAADALATKSISEGRESSSSLESSSRTASSISGGVATNAQPASEGSPAEADDDEVIVVHVLAKPAAIRNKTFDTLLADNGVVVDADEGKVGALGYRAESASPQPPAAVASGRALELEEQAAQPADESSQVKAKLRLEEEVEVVLVEAPSSTIFSCVEDLNKDSANYLGVLVDPSPAMESFGELKSPPAKKLATDLGVYNRGTVPLQPEGAYWSDKTHYYDYFGATNEKLDAAAESNRVGGAQNAPLSSSNRSTNSDRGRARRLQASDSFDRRQVKLYARSGEPASGRAAAKSETAGAEMMKRRDMVSKLADASGNAEDPMQVLFVLRAGDEPQPSAPAADRAE